MSMTAAGIIGLITGIASLIGSGISTAKKVDDSSKTTEYQKKLAADEERRKKKDILESNKSSKKAAIARAINSQNVLMPKQQQYQKPPEPLNLNPVDVGGIVQGVAGSANQLVGGLSDMGIGNKPLSASKSAAPVQVDTNANPYLRDWRYS